MIASFAARSKGEILVPSRCFPLFTQQRTFQEDKSRQGHAVVMPGGLLFLFGNDSLRQMLPFETDLDQVRPEATRHFRELIEIRRIGAFLQPPRLGADLSRNGGHQQ